MCVPLCGFQVGQVRATMTGMLGHVRIGQGSAGGHYPLMPTSPGGRERQGAHEPSGGVTGPKVPSVLPPSSSTVPRPDAVCRQEPQTLFPLGESSSLSSQESKFRNWADSPVLPAPPKAPGAL